MYTNNGSSYELNNVISTTAPLGVYRLIVSADFEELTYVENSLLKIFHKQNNSYALFEEQDAGKDLLYCESNS